MGATARNRNNNNHAVIYCVFYYSFHRQMPHLIVFNAVWWLKL